MKKNILYVTYFLLLSQFPQAALLEVGSGKTYSRIEDAVTAASSGDVIDVYAENLNKPYEKVAVLIDKPGITIRGISRRPGERVNLSGHGFNYSGKGSVPRAIIQFNPNANNCTIENFRLTGAHNASYNGAGVRINQANNVTIRNCQIFANDMGIMSNGDGTKNKGQNQLIEHCIIFANGNTNHPGYNHNLYLGGASVTVQFNEIHSSLTGHNIKSRAHYNRVTGNYIHDSANRELDLVDSKETEIAGTTSLVAGNIIVKKSKMTGNKTVIHFGQDGKMQNNGRLILVYNTIITPYTSPVVDLSTKESSLLFLSNLVFDGSTQVGKRNLLKLKIDAELDNIKFTKNWFSKIYRDSIHSIGKNAEQNYFAVDGKNPLRSMSDGDFSISDNVEAVLDNGFLIQNKMIAPMPGVKAEEPPEKFFLNWQYKHPANKEPREFDGKPDIGAFEFK